MQSTLNDIQFWTVVTDGNEVIALGNDGVDIGFTTNKTLNTFDNENDLETFVNNLKSDNSFYKECIKTGYNNNYIYPSLKYPELNPVVEN